MEILKGLGIVLGCVSLTLLIFFIYSILIEYIRECHTLKIAYKEYKKTVRKMAKDFYDIEWKAIVDTLDSTFEKVSKDDKK